MIFEQYSCKLCGSDLFGLFLDSTVWLLLTPFEIFQTTSRHQKGLHKSSNNFYRYFYIDKIYLKHTTLSFILLQSFFEELQQITMISAFKC